MTPPPPAWLKAWEAPRSTNLSLPRRCLQDQGLSWFSVLGKYLHTQLPDAGMILRKKRSTSKDVFEVSVSTALEARGSASLQNQGKRKVENFLHPNTVKPISTANLQRTRSSQINYSSRSFTGFVSMQESLSIGTALTECCDFH